MNSLSNLGKAIRKASNEEPPGTARQLAQKVGYLKMATNKRLSGVSDDTRLILKTFNDYASAGSEDSVEIIEQIQKAFRKLKIKDKGGAWTKKGLQWLEAYEIARSRSIEEIRSEGKFPGRF